MRNFFIGLGVILGISLSIVGLKYLLNTGLGISEDSIGTIFFVFMVLAISKPFGELTVSVFKLNKST
tara:strand:- start:2941 stop:3141 length:201 start_codon:yes stop_codon:yes gene_type:complete